MKSIYLMPHISDVIPEKYKKQFVCTGRELEETNKRMTDTGVDKLFWFINDKDTVKGKVSRLVIDIERFADDKVEDMSKLGMGMYYTHNDRGLLIREPNSALRAELKKKYYDPYHLKIQQKVNEALKKNERILLLDCHSFGDNVSYTGWDKILYPDICIGVDSYHTDENMCSHIMKIFEMCGFSVAYNIPFGGCLIPVENYQKDYNVRGIMIEINKRAYLTQDGRFSPRAEKLSGTLANVAHYIKEYK